MTELVLLAERGAGDIIAIGRKTGHDTADVLKAWESQASIEREVEEFPHDAHESQKAGEVRLLRALDRIPAAPTW